MIHELGPSSGRGTLSPMCKATCSLAIQMISPWAHVSLRLGHYGDEKRASKYSFISATSDVRKSQDNHSNYVLIRTIVKVSVIIRTKLEEYDNHFDIISTPDYGTS